MRAAVESRSEAAEAAEKADPALTALNPLASSGRPAVGGGFGGGRAKAAAAEAALNALIEVLRLGAGLRGATLLPTSGVHRGSGGGGGGRLTLGFREKLFERTGAGALPGRSPVEIRPLPPTESRELDT